MIDILLWIYWIGVVLFGGLNAWLMFVTWDELDRGWFNIIVEPVLMTAGWPLLCVWRMVVGYYYAIVYHSDGGD